MAARRVSQASVDWAAMASRVPENQKVIFAAFKAKSDAYLRRVMANPETAPKIDWEYYRSRVPVKGMVDDFQKQYEALKVPYPPDNVSQQVDAQEQQAKKEIAEFVKNSNLRIATYEEEIKKTKALLPYDQMTMEDFKDSFPDLAMDTINRPTFWPHTPEEQPGYKDPAQSGH